MKFLLSSIKRKKNSTFYEDEKKHTKLHSGLIEKVIRLQLRFYIFFFWIVLAILVLLSFIIMIDKKVLTVTKKTLLIISFW